MGQPAANSNRSSAATLSLSRRHFVQAACLLGVGTAAAQPLAAQSPPATATQPAAAKRALLMQPADVSQLNTRSKIVLELDGVLRIRPADSQKEKTPRTAEVKAKSTLDYFETVALGVAAIPTAAARQYNEAGVENWVAGSASSYQLRPECQATRMLMHAGQWQQYCEGETLDVREVELLASPINTAALELLLPVEAAKPDSSWTVAPEHAQHLFNLDAVHQSTLVAKIVKVEKGVATIEIEGELEATAHSVPTRLQIKGNFHAQMGRQCAVVTWVGLVIKEDREISQAEPGFSITARVRMIRAEEANSRVAISHAELMKLANEDAPGRWLVRLQSTAGRCSMLADRNWRVFLDSGEDVILRMVENNSVVAQCNITRLAPLTAGQQLTVEGLQSDIRTTLGDGFGQFLESSEKVTASKLRLLRTVVAGEREEVPIQWIYCHLSDDSGRRTLMTFTMGGTETDRFAAADEQMSGSFELLPEPSDADGAPTAAPKLTADKATAEAQR